MMLNAACWHLISIHGSPARESCSDKSSDPAHPGRSSGSHEGASEPGSLQDATLIGMAEPQQTRDDGKEAIDD